MDWKGKTVVYTAVAGDNEHPKPSHVFEDGVDYLYFSNGAATPPGPWQTHDLSQFNHLHLRRAAKIPKLAPHEFAVLTKYRYAIWIDGDMTLNSNRFAEELLSHMTNGLVLSPHYEEWRHCAYAEATIRPPKYASEPLDAQVAFYRSEGFPEQAGLYSGGLMARDMKHARARELGYRWLTQNMIFSYQDQVSLPYCLWKMRYRPGVLPKSIWKYDWVIISAHKSEAM